MITYKKEIKVYLDEKHVGNIKECSKGYYYHPKGRKDIGDIYPSIEQVKASLEEE